MASPYEDNPPFLISDGVFAQRRHHADLGETSIKLHQLDVLLLGLSGGCE